MNPDPLHVDDEPWPTVPELAWMAATGRRPQPRPDRRWLLVLAVVVLLGLYRALRKENRE